MATQKQELRIKLRSFDHKNIVATSTKIIETVKRAGANVSGLITLRHKKKRFTVNRSPHVNKKSREQFEIRRYSGMIIIYNPSADIVKSLNSVDVPSALELNLIYN